MYDTSQIKNELFETTTVEVQKPPKPRAGEIKLRASRKFKFLELFFEKFWVLFLMRQVRYLGA